jgi:hypothetical protein
MAARHQPEILGLGDGGASHEGANVIFIGAPGLRVGDVGKPLSLSWDLLQSLKLRVGQGVGRQGRDGGHDEGDEIESATPAWLG